MLLACVFGHEVKPFLLPFASRKHENIVEYIHSIRTDTELYIVLAFVDGGSIAGLLKKHGAFPEILSALYTKQWLEALKKRYLKATRY